ncbi:MAG: hypothetical protein CL908_19960 [Deltaproteobacteria bacterium]|nr:hypothetical protein [Deltaproteobacteria bacterium]
MSRTILLLLAATVMAGPGGAQRPSLPNFDRRTPIVLAVENVGPAVVNIRTQDAVRRTGGFDIFQRFDRRKIEQDPRTGLQFSDRSLGSGVIVHEAGYIITNEHVIAGADRIKVRLRTGELKLAKVLNSNRDNDIAVLKLADKGPYPTAILGNSDQLLIGEVTMALGNPFGLSNSVTDGILSASGRSVRFRGREVFSDFLQTSATINPGNSGGPLLDVNGRVIGINVAIDKRGPGIGYAIPINRVKEVITTLTDPEMTRQAWLGLETARKRDALVISRIMDPGPAEAAGLRVGDRILSVASRPVETPFEFNVVMMDATPGASVPFRVSRNGRTVDRAVRFTTLPLESLFAHNARADILGMNLANLTNAAAARLHIPSHLIGPVVLNVKTESAAEKIELQRGDVIIEVGRVATPTVNRLREVLGYYRRRGSARIKVYRENEGELQGTIVF